MSYDRHIDQLCPHLVVEEFLQVQGDRQTVFPIRPIASADSVVVRVNGVVDVPSFGIEIPASTSGTKEGPFTIVTGVNDTVRVRVNNEAVQTAVLPASSRMLASQVVQLLNASLRGVRFSSEQEFLRMKSETAGPDSTVYLEAGSTFAASVGFKINRQYRGKRTFPGWTLVSDPTTLADRPRRLIVFDEPLQANSNFAEINYTTVRQECRRCGGIGVENDWRYGRDGKVVEVRDEALLIQELLKAMYTIRGSNPFHAWYGTSIVERIGSKFVVDGLIQNQITSDIYTMFSRWQSLKRQQEEKVGQVVTDREFPYQLTNVICEKSQKDQTVLFVNMEVRNRSFEPIQLTRGLRLPQPTDLLGSTQQQGVFRQSLTNYSLVT